MKPPVRADRSFWLGPFVEESAYGLQEGDRTARGPGPQRRAATIFRRRSNRDGSNRERPALHRETK